MAQNMFANVDTLDKLNFEFEICTSPENLHMDGERSPKDAKKVYTKIQKDFEARRYQIVLGERSPK